MRHRTAGANHTNRLGEMYIRSEGWRDDPTANEVCVVSGGEISARFVAPKPLETPPRPRDKWPDPVTLKGNRWHLRPRCRALDSASIQLHLSHHTHRVSRMETVELLDAVIELIERWGWVQQTSESEGSLDLVAATRSGPACRRDTRRPSSTCSPRRSVRVAPPCARNRG